MSPVLSLLEGGGRGVVSLHSIALTECLEMAIKAHREGKVMCPQEKHERVRTLYTWANVAERTEKVCDTSILLGYY